MAKRYTKKTTRSRRREEKVGRGQIAGMDEGRVQLWLPIAQVLAGAQEAVEALAAQAGVLVMGARIDEEVESVVGRRYAHDEDRVTLHPHAGI